MTGDLFLDFLIIKGISFLIVYWLIMRTVKNVLTILFKGH
jgi:hypothetical protein